MEANFSFHAYERVLGRISMSHKELAELLDADLAIDIGQESGTNRSHKLFYSTRDKMCFVAIQDVKTGTVVTLLPIDYHENICWVVSIDVQKQAKELVTNDEATTSDKKILDTNATVFRISVNAVDYYGKYLKTMNLGSWPCGPYEHSIDSLIEDRKFVDYIVEQINKKRCEVEKDRPIYLPTVAIRIGSKGDPVFFSTSELIESNA